MNYYGDNNKISFRSVVRGDILVILKKDGSCSLIKIERFKEVAYPPEDKPKIMIDYIQLLPEISHEPLIALSDFESMIKEIRLVMNIPDQEWEEFFKFFRFSKSLHILEEAYGSFEDSDERRVIH